MSDAAKKELHELVDALPNHEVVAARRYFEFLRDQGSDPYAHLGEQDPFENLSDGERERLHAALEQSEREFAVGKGIPADVVMRELRSSRRRSTHR